MAEIIIDGHSYTEDEHGLVQVNLLAIYDGIKWKTYRRNKNEGDEAMQIRVQEKVTALQVASALFLRALAAVIVLIIAAMILAVHRQNLSAALSWRRARGVHPQSAASRHWLQPCVPAAQRRKRGLRRLKMKGK